MRERTPIPFDEAMRETFLERLAEHGNASRAARECGYKSPKTPYEWKKRNPEFAAEWQAALEMFYDSLEDEARRRSAEGTIEPVFYRGVQTGEIRKFSDTLLMFLLEGARPEKYRKNIKISADEAKDLDDAIARELAKLAATEETSIS